MANRHAVYIVGQPVVGRSSASERARVGGWVGGWMVGWLGGGGVASLAQHHRGNGPASSLGRVSMGTEQRAVCAGGLVVEFEAVVEVDSESGCRLENQYRWGRR